MTSVTNVTEQLRERVGFPHVMIDLETLSTELDCAILSIGAQVFDPLGTGYVEDDQNSFYCKIKLQSCIDAGMRIDAATLEEFWFSEEAYPAIRSTFYGDTKIEHALYKLSEWMPKDAKVWGHGSTFDCAILIHAYKKFNRPLPWHFRHSRDTRTLFDCFPTDKDSQRVGVLHNALDDARSQILWVQSSFKTLTEMGGLALQTLIRYSQIEMSAVDHKESIVTDGACS